MCVLQYKIHTRYMCNLFGIEVTRKQANGMSQKSITMVPLYWYFALLYIYLSKFFFENCQQCVKRTPAINFHYFFCLFWC